MKKFFAVLCVLGILVIFPLTLLGTVAKYHLFKPAVLKQIVRASQIGEYLPELIASAMTQANESANGDTSALSTTDATDLVTTALPPEDVYVITDQVIDAIGPWFNTNKPIEQLDLKIDLTKLKQNLAPAISERVSVYVEDLPTCESGFNFNELNTMDGADLEAMQQVDCIPTGFDVTSLLGGSQQMIGDAVLKNVPNELTTDTIITEQLQQSNIPLASLNATVNQVRSTWRWVNIGIWVGWGVIGFLLLSLVLLRHKPAYAIFGWLGWTHLFMTLELVPLALILWLAPQLILPWLSSTVNLAGITVINTTVTQAMRVLLWPVLWTMLGTTVLMVLHFIIRLIIKLSSKKGQPTVSTPVVTTVQPPPQ